MVGVSTPKLLVREVVSEGDTASKDSIGVGVEGPPACATSIASSMQGEVNLSSSILLSDRLPSSPLSSLFCDTFGHNCTGEAGDLEALEFPPSSELPELES